uniref:Mitochondrial carrier protein n=1 Tax=viral metagenome TaxID=1070528 RepID=A0A6C0EB98_9ZZZZ
MDFICGCVGGFVGTMISHPIDTIKTRIQTTFTLSQALKLRQFYSGITSPLIGIPLEKSIVFGVCDIAKSYNLNSFCSGVLAGFTSVLIVTPVEYFKINSQNMHSIKLTSIKLKNVYRGIIPTICRESLGYGIYFTTYDTLTQNYNSEKSLWKCFIFGGITGITSWAVIFPTDAVKTVMQDTNSGSKNTGDIIRSIYKQKGVMGFYKGFNFAIMRAIPLHAGVFAGYELSKQMFYLH